MAYIMHTRVTRKDIKEAFADGNKVIFLQLADEVGMEVGKRLEYMLGRTTTGKIIAIFYTVDAYTAEPNVLSAHDANKDEEAAYVYGGANRYQNLSIRLRGEEGRHAPEEL
jgi:hypothetical protein